MPELSVIQIVIVLVIALLVFGPSRLPEMGRQLGRGLREVRRHASSVTRDLTRAVDEPSETRREAASHPAAQAPSDDDPLDGVVVPGDEPVRGSRGAGTGSEPDDDVLSGVVVSGDEPPAGQHR